MVPKGLNQAFLPQISKIPQGKITQTPEFKKDMNQLSLLFSMSLQQVMYKHWIAEQQSYLDSIDGILAEFIENTAHLPEKERSKALARYKEQCMNAERTVFKNLCNCLRNDFNATKSKTCSAPCALTEIQIKQLLGTDAGPVYKSLLNCTNPQASALQHSQMAPAKATGNLDNLNLPASLKLTPKGPAPGPSVLTGKSGGICSASGHSDYSMSDHPNTHSLAKSVEFCSTDNLCTAEPPSNHKHKVKDLIITALSPPLLHQLIVTASHSPLKLSN